MEIWTKEGLGGGQKLQQSAIVTTKLLLFVIDLQHSYENAAREEHDFHQANERKNVALNSWMSNMCNDTQLKVI